MSLAINVLGFATVCTTVTWLSYEGARSLFTNKNKRRPETVTVRTHTRRKPRSTTRIDEKGFKKFKKHREAGLKGNNPSRFRRVKKVEAMKNQMDNLWEKVNYYNRVGDTAKARACSRKIEQLDSTLMRMS